MAGFKAVTTVEVARDGDVDLDGAAQARSATGRRRADDHQPQHPGLFERPDRRDRRDGARGGRRSMYMRRREHQRDPRPRPARRPASTSCTSTCTRPSRRRTAAAGPGAGPVGVQRAPGAVPARRRRVVEATRRGARNAWAGRSTPERLAPRRDRPQHRQAPSAATSACSCAPTPISAANGGDGLREVSEDAVLNANYLRARLAERTTCRTTAICMHEVRLLRTPPEATARRQHARHRQAR